MTTIISPAAINILIEQTFNQDKTTLLTINSIKYLFNKCTSNAMDDGEETILWSRGEYVKYSHSLLNQDLMKHIVWGARVLKVENSVIELAAGKGWLSWWLSKYGLNVAKCVDDKSWHLRREYTDNVPYLDIVTKGDAIEAMIDGPCMYILCWPDYKGTLASRIWNNMKKGQYLLYIGLQDDATGDAAFHEQVWGSEYARLPHMDSVYPREVAVIFEK